MIRFLVGCLLAIVVVWAAAFTFGIVLMVNNDHKAPVMRVKP